jgi:hypothetical protein
MDYARTLWSRSPWILAAALVGAGAFVLAQVLGGFPTHIADFMGAQVVSRGGYSESLQGVIGWGVHLGVSIGYATLFAALALLPFVSQRRPERWAHGLALAGVLAVGSTLLTVPAISITVSVLAGQGLPGELPGLNATWGFVLWNHVAFFVICWALILVVPDLLSDREPPA